MGGFVGGWLGGEVCYVFMCVVVVIVVVVAVVVIVVASA